MEEKSRIQKILAASGVASRRKAEELLSQGRVTVNGRVAHVVDSAIPDKHRLAVDGQPVVTRGMKIYLSLSGDAGVWPSW